MKPTKWKVEGSYIPRRLEVITSPAWKAAPRALKAILEVLEIEHMRHKGSANGLLFKSYPQFVEEGFNRTTVSTMTKIGEALGLLKVDRKSGYGPPELRDACAYTLTYLPTGPGARIAPSDEWKRIKTDAQAEAIVNDGKPVKKEAIQARRKVA